MLRKAQSCNLIATNPSEVVKMEVDNLKQYSLDLKPCDIQGKTTI